MCNKYGLLAGLLLVVGQPVFGQVPCGKVEAMAANELVEYIKHNVAAAHPCVAVAVDRLGLYPSEATAEFLTTILDYRRPATRAEATGTTIRPPSTQNLYPAVGSLLQIGERAIPALLRYMVEATSLVGTKNARTTLMLLFRDNPLEGIKRLRFAGAGLSKDRRERLASAASELAQWCTQSQMQQCAELAAFDSKFTDPR